MFLFGYLFFSFLNFATIPRQNVRDVSFSECPIEDTEISVTTTTVLPTFPTDSTYRIITQQSVQCCVMSSCIEILLNMSPNPFFKNKYVARNHCKSTTYIVIIQKNI